MPPPVFLSNGAKEQSGFAGARVLSLESRRRSEIEQLISKRGGVPVVAPSVREVPLASNPDIRTFATELCAGDIDTVIFTTGVGTRALFEAAQSFSPLEPLLAALHRTKVVARSNKPAAVLRDLKVPITLLAPEPNTWREVVQALEQNGELVPLAGQRVAIQEHGAPSAELAAFLTERSARVLPIHVYRWELPEDLIPLRDAIHALVGGRIEVVLFTASVQLQHLLAVAEEMRLRDQVLDALRHTVVVSIGPVTSAELSKWAVMVDVEPAHPKMGFLVKEAADRSAELIRQKRAGRQ